MSAIPSAVPPGWEFNPSAPSQRAPRMIVSGVALVAAIACALYTRGIVGSQWEPFPRIEGGWLLRAVPADLPELDCVAFALLLLLAAVGPRDRWRSHAWLPVASLGVAFVEAASAVVRWSVQYSVQGAVSTLFTVVAACAIIAFPLTADEAFAALVQRQRTRKAMSPYREIEGPRGERIGFRVNDWTGYLAGAGAILVGAWLLLASLPPRAAGDAHLLGAFVIAFGAASLVQVARFARFANLAFGAWLLIAPLAHGYTLRGTIHFLISGLILLMLSVLADPVSRDEPPHARHA